MRSIELIKLIREHGSDYCNEFKELGPAKALSEAICEVMVPREVYVQAISKIAEQELEIKTVRMLLAAKQDRPVLKGEGL